MKQVAFETWLWRTLGHFKPGKSRVGDLPPEALAYLTLQNPALRDLKERYSRFTGAPHSSWSSWEEKVNLTKFRGENDYLSQAYFTRTTRRYEMTCAYAEATDELGLLDRFTEDDLFGVKTWPFLPGKPVTRDLLDSVIELTWLSKALGFGLNDSFRILDIGAGYGRFAHRFSSGFPKGRITCTDAVATSTFLSEFYLRFRNAGERARVVPLDQVDKLPAGQFDLATNIHSWSECTKAFVAFWLDRVCALNIPHLFIVPHFANLSTKEPDGAVATYDDELERRGFKLVLKQRKFHRSKLVDSCGVFPADYRLYKRG